MTGALAQGRLPFFVIGGYLGAGKTSLLNRLLAGPHGLRIAVLVNDFGSVNIDAELIGDRDGATLSLANGCLCCSLQDGFAAAIGSILAQADRLDLLVIEASGVADPIRIAHYGQMYGLPLRAIVIVVDAEQIRTQADNKYVGDTVVRQLAKADLIVLNKIDLVEEAGLQETEQWVRGHAPDAPLLRTTGGEVPIELLSEFDGHAADALALPAHDHAAHAAFETKTITLAQPVPRERIERMAATLGPHYYRAKGFAWIEDDPAHRYLYQQVGSRFSLTREEPWRGDPSTLLVLIGLAHGQGDHHHQRADDPDLAPGAILSGR